jgi:nucleoside permease NupC
MRENPPKGVIMEDITTTLEDTNKKSTSVVAIALVGFAAYGVFTAVGKVNHVVKARIERRAIKQFKQEMELNQKLAEVGK